MASFTDYAEKAILDHVLGTSPMTSPTIYLGLFTSDPTDTGDQSGEVSAGDYSRLQINFNAAAGANPAVADNDGKISFPQATNNWGTITHVGLMDAATGGNMIMHGPLQSSETIDSGDTFEIADGSLDVEQD